MRGNVALAVNQALLGVDAAGDVDCGKLHAAAAQIRRILPVAGSRDSIAKPAVSNHAVLTSAIVRVFPSFEHAMESVRTAKDNFKIFVQRLAHR